MLRLWYLNEQFIPSFFVQQQLITASPTTLRIDSKQAILTPSTIPRNNWEKQLVFQRRWYNYHISWWASKLHLTRRNRPSWIYGNRHLELLQIRRIYSLVLVAWSIISSSFGSWSKSLIYESLKTSKLITSQ